jgi:hypothetical protein
VLELLDAAVKVYRQYFGVLIGFSAIVTAATVFGPGGILLYPLLLPLNVGPVACAIAAAVRGRPVTFNQCWQFTQPRFNRLLTTSLLVGLILFFALIALGILGALLIAGGLAAIANAPVTMRWAIGIGGGLLLAVLLSVLVSALLCWGSLAPVVAAMEEDKRNASAMSRAWELLDGHWLRVVSLMTMLGLGYMALAGICLGAGVAVAGVITGLGSLRELLTGNTGGAAFWIAYLIFVLSQVLLGILWNPIQFLLMTMFYLDVRVRKEALDIEWGAYQSTPAPAAPSSTPDFSAASADLAPAPELSPAVEGEAGALICPQCRTRNLAGQTLCAACGTRLQPLW